MMAYSAPRSPCTPEELVRTAPFGSQSSGIRWLTPAPWAATHLSLGAAFIAGRSKSHPNTASAV